MIGFDELQRKVEDRLADSVEHRVSMEIVALENAVTNLWRMLLGTDPALRAEVLKRELEIWPAAGNLRALIEEIRDRNDNTKWRV
jgi:hypothetical protein